TLLGVAGEEALELIFRCKLGAEIVHDGGNRIVAAEPLIQGFLLRQSAAGDECERDERERGKTEKLHGPVPCMISMTVNLALAGTAIHAGGRTDNRRPCR